MNILVCLPMEDAHKEMLESRAPGEKFTYCGSERITEELVKEADIIIGNVRPAYLKDSLNLKWLQLSSAGTDGYCDSGIFPAGAILTNATGAYGQAVSEHMLASVMMLQKKLHLYYQNQMEHRWRSEGIVQGMEGSVVLVIGLGDVGTNFAKKAKALGAYTIGIKKRESQKPLYIDEQYTLEYLDEFIPKADVIAITLPGNDETTKLFNSEKIYKMKKSAILANGGRGIVVDTDALYQALKEKRILGAALDVVDPEPLPIDSPLWKLSNIIITPHISGGFSLPSTFERVVAISADNLERFMKGNALKNQINFDTGYCK